jgi:GNAT superfamily N-acetyltransferase
MQNMNLSIKRLDASSAPGVSDLYRTVYGDDFPLASVYDPSALLEANQQGRQVNLVALEEDRVVGQAVTVRSAWNPRLYELVGLMVLPEFRKSGLGGDLARALLEDVFPTLKWGVRYTESVTAHVRSKKVDIAMGHVHCALALENVPAKTFGHDKVFGDVSRGSSIMSFFENREDPSTGTTVIPARYADVIQELASGFSPRIFTEDMASQEEISELQVIPFADAGTVYLVGKKVGEDMSVELDKVLEEISGMYCTLLQLPLVPGISAAVEVARERGFFLGGFLPGWFPEGDGILLQRLTSEPDWDAIKVLSGKGKRLLELVRNDREELK